MDAMTNELIVSVLDGEYIPSIILFNEFQLDCIIHENYTMEQISRLVRRFNFNKGMTVPQKRFTFCDKYARKLREILKRGFFIEAPYTKAERTNGTLERVAYEWLPGCNDIPCAPGKPSFCGIIHAHVFMVNFPD